MNSVLQAIRDRRSVRQFSTQPVSSEQIDQILEAGRWAPSGKNTQPWRFVVVTHEAKRKQLARLAPQQQMIETAPVTLAILYDTNAGYDGLKDVQGIGAAVQNILLAVHSLDLAACWMGKTREPQIEAVVEAGEHEELMALIPVGHPAEQPEGGSRHPMPTLRRDL